MSQYFKQYLKKNNFKQYLKYLQHKLKNKTVIIYGTGILFQYIVENYDLSKLNIIGVSDMKYSENFEGKEEFGYKIIPKDKMIQYNPDCVLIALENYFTIIENMQNKIFQNTDTILLPFIRKSIWDLINFVWVEK